MDPNPFFATILSSPWKNNVVLSPHIYPPSVTNGTLGSNTGAGLYDRLTRSFGAYTKQVGSHLPDPQLNMLLLQLPLLLHRGVLGPLLWGIYEGGAMLYSSK